MFKATSQYRCGVDKAFLARRTNMSSLSHEFKRPTEEDTLHRKQDYLTKILACGGPFGKKILRQRYYPRMVKELIRVITTGGKKDEMSFFLERYRFTWSSSSRDDWNAFNQLLLADMIRLAEKDQSEKITSEMLKIRNRVAEIRRDQERSTWPFSFWILP